GSILSFIYEKNDFPFLGGRTLLFKEKLFESLDITWESGNMDTHGNGWDRIAELLEEGHPVVLRVDMRYLPYLHGGKYGSKYTSFGWHMICLTGIDAEKGLAYVTDTEKSGIQTLKLADLNKARFSKLDVMPPEGQFYSIETAPDDFSVNWEEIAVKSLRIIEKEMSSLSSDEKNLKGLDGLSKLPETLTGLDSEVKSYLLKPVLEFHYGSIETNGTGGAAFRTMYHESLFEAAEKSGNQSLLEAA
ncbi:MAG: BtrH N-terminal domain-containing protein, partial [Proteobacteria bacterium]|nr:BtrH N-terminal domain-containing protein [Pseudomonadota bacterium]